MNFDRHILQHWTFFWSVQKTVHFFYHSHVVTVIVVGLSDVRHEGLFMGRLVTVGLQGHSRVTAVHGPNACLALVLPFLWLVHLHVSLPLSYLWSCLVIGLARLFGLPCRSVGSFMGRSVIAWLAWVRGPKLWDGPRTFRLQALAWSCLAIGLLP